MAFELCLRLGCPHPSRLTQPPWSLTYDDLEDWLIFYHWQPFGERRKDWRNAVLAAFLTDTEGEAPSLVWPYWSQAGLDHVGLALEAFDDHRRLYHLA